MKKENLQKAIFEAYSSTISSCVFDSQDVNLSTIWCLNKYDTDYFINLLEEKVMEDCSFLKNKRFDILQDVYSEVERFYPVEEETKPLHLTKAKTNTSMVDFSDRQHD